MDTHSLLHRFPCLQILSESQFRLTEFAEFFVAEVCAIKKAITDTQRRCFGEVDINLDSKSALKVLYNIGPRHIAIAEIKDLVKQNKVEAYKHWITVHMEHIFN